MKHKQGTCSMCEREASLYAKGLCYFCYWSSKRKAIKPSKKLIMPISKNRQEALKKYRRIRDKFLKDHPICQYPGCNSREVTLHHAAGRIGSFLTDKRHFRSLCWPHHQFIETHPDQAIKLGLSVKRLAK